MNFIIKLLISGFAVVISSYLIPGVSVDTYWTAIVVAAILGLLNVLVKPVLIILTIPITLISLGLFLLVINAIIILMADSLISGFVVDNFWWALLFSIVLALVNSLFEEFSKR